MAKRFAPSEDVFNNVEVSENKKKRKSKLLHDILQELELLFEDAKLIANGDLRDRVERDAFVPINVFLKFQNIQKHTESIEVLIESIKTSSLLELDETNEKVRRKIPLQIIDDQMERTIYVEGLPVNVVPSWLLKKFTQFGKISKITLPKYSKSCLPKGFCFIEFTQVNSVAKVMKSFHVINGTICVENVDPAKLASAQALNCKTAPTNLKVMQHENDIVKEVITLNKRKIEDLITNENKNKQDLEHLKTHKAKNSSIQSENLLKNLKNNKAKNFSIQSENITKLTESDLFYKLKVMLLVDWQLLRAKNFQMLRSIKAELKQKVNEEIKWHRAANQLAKGMLIKKKTHKLRREIRVMKNYFQNANKSTPAPPMSLSFKFDTLVKHESGLIVEITYKNVQKNNKFLKWRLQQYKNVKYVDFKEGDKTAYVRFETAYDAFEFVKLKNCAKHRCVILSGQAEDAYWLKIESDRKMKLNKQIKIRSKRGREKINAKIKKLNTIEASD